jgi:GNAT superfamily N-acetyltransferase
MKKEVSFKDVITPEAISRVSELASIIWIEHYTPIIGKDQVNYMLEQFQSEAAITRQIADNTTYFLIEEGPDLAGYLAIRKRKRELFLSKIYLLEKYRGQGLGRAAMGFIGEKAREFGCDRIVLTVNKNNVRSIEAYEKMGFENRGPLVTDIGGGFIMDDYLLVKFLMNTSSGAAGSSPV